MCCDQSIINCHNPAAFYERKRLTGGGMEKRRRRAGAHYIYYHGGVTSRRVISHFKRITHKNAPVLIVWRLLKAPLSSRLITPFAFISRIWTAERERDAPTNAQKAGLGQFWCAARARALSRAPRSAALCLQARTPTGVCLGNPHITTDQLVAYQYKLTRNWFAQLERADGRAQSDLNYGWNGICRIRSLVNMRRCLSPVQHIARVWAMFVCPA